MIIITFIYKIGRHPKTYYGKYITEYIADDHDGLDIEILPVLIASINLFRTYKKLPRLKTVPQIGIISCSDESNYLNYASSNEINCFDFYYVKFEKKYPYIYINGDAIL